MKQILLFLITGLILCSCHIYHPDIQQGNELKPEEVAKIKVGMTQTEVTDILGQPVLTNAFDLDQMNYVYTLQKHGGPIKEHQLTIYLKDGKIERIEDNDNLIADKPA